MAYVLSANLELLVMNILLVVILFCFNIRYWKSNWINPLSVIYVLVILGSLSEMAAFYADKKVEYIWLNYAGNIIYFISLGLLSACYIEYCSQQFPKPIWKNIKQHALIMLPILFEIACIISAPVTGLIFHVSDTGEYSRAVSFVIQMIPYLYLIVGAGISVSWFKRSELTSDRNKYLALASFIIPPFILGGLQLFIPENSLDILEFSITLSLLCNYAVSQNNRITRDTLTRLPNREVLDVVIREKINLFGTGSEGNLYVMMCDMDGFKGINDTYGHIEGDNALKDTADVLFEVSKEFKGTAARFAGDEFVIVVDAADDEIPKQIIKNVNKKLVLASEGKKYQLKMSIGYAVYQSGEKIADVLRRADKELYAVKKQNKAGR